MNTRKDIAPHVALTKAGITCYEYQEADGKWWPAENADQWWGATAIKVYFRLTGRAPPPPPPPPRPSPRSHQERPLADPGPRPRHPERQIAVYALQLIESEPPAAAAIPETLALTALNPNY